MLHLLGQLASNPNTLKAPKNLSKTTVSTNSKIYGFNNDKAKLNAWQKAVNEAAFELAKEEPDLLYNRAELKTKAEAEARKSYIFKKKTGTRSVHVPEDGEPKPKRSKISSDERKEKISSVSIQLELITKQISSKQQLCSKATTVKDYALCAKLQGEIRQLFKEKGGLETQLKLLQTKERKSSWYQKRNKPSLPPPQCSSKSSSMDIRKLLTVKTTSSTCTKAAAPEVPISQQSKHTETETATDKNEALVNSSVEVQVSSSTDASFEKEKATVDNGDCGLSSAEGELIASTDASFEKEKATGENEDCVLLSAEGKLISSTDASPPDNKCGHFLF